VINYVIEVKVF